MTNSERVHQLADNHAQGTHDSDPQFDCYDCWPWTNGYGAQVLASLSANTDCKPEWWHSGGGLHGIYVTYQGFNYFVGAADEPNVGMDISNEQDETHLGSANFGSLEDYTPSEMGKRIWAAIDTGEHVILNPPEWAIPYILSEYPDKSWQWANEQLQKSVANTEIAIQDITREQVRELFEITDFPAANLKPLYDAHMATDCDHNPARKGGCEVEANCAFCGVDHYPTFHDEVQATKLHVVSVEAQHTGGGVVATLTTLSDGRILIGSNSDESVQIYANLKRWDEGAGVDDEEGEIYDDLPTALVELGIVR